MLYMQEMRKVVEMVNYELEYVLRPRTAPARGPGPAAGCLSSLALHCASCCDSPAGWRPLLAAARTDLSVSDTRLALLPGPAVLERLTTLALPRCHLTPDMVTTVLLRAATGGLHSLGETRHHHHTQIQRHRKPISVALSSVESKLNMHNTH